MTRIHPPLAAAPRASWPRRALCLLLAVQLGLPLQSTAATINFAQQPMASTTATVVKPNLMFVLDDSGSMDQDYTPDYVNDSAKCFDSGDDNSSNGSIADSRDTCVVGMPPYMSPDFNKAYYSPEIVYKAGVNADGSSKGDQTNLASVATDPYGKQQRNQFGNSMTTVNLTTAYPDVVSCATPGATPASGTTVDANCKTNVGFYTVPGSTDYVYPDAVFPYNKYRGGMPPYYYRIIPTEFCSDEALTSCIASNVASGIYTIPAPVRFCKNSSPANTQPLTDCQGLFDAANSYTIPKFLGYVVPASSGTQAYGIIDIGTVTAGFSVDTVTVNGVGIIGSAVVAGGADTSATIATALANRINSTNSTPEYRACVGSRTGSNTCSGTPNNRVIVFPQSGGSGSTTPLLGTGPNGLVIATTGATNTPGSQAVGTITITGTSAAPARVTAVKVGTTTAMSGTVDAPNGLDTAAKRNALAASLAAAINQNGYTATVSGSVISVYSPSANPADNGKTITVNGKLSSSATLAINDNGAGNTLANITVVKNTSGGTTINSGSASSAGGSNSTAERNALAASLAGVIIANGYTASATGSSNITTVYTPIGTTATTTPFVTYTPATASAVPAASAVATITFSSANNAVVSAVRINPAGACSVSVANLLTGATSASSSTSTVASRIDGKDSGSDAFSITSSSSKITVTESPITLGASLNGCQLQVVTSGGTLSPLTALFNNAGTLGSPAITALVTPTAFSGGYSSTSSTATYVTAGTMSGGSFDTGALNVTSTNLANGADAGPDTRMEVGSFKRCDITPNNDCINGGTFAGGKFPRASTRTDCAAATHCTYAEEAKNFGNWYAYYRTRMQMMKSAAGLAFSDIGSNFRVGFMTIHLGTSNYLKIQDFDTTNKSTWYTRFYNISPSGGTPLRSALAAAGRIFAGKNPLGFGTTDDPMQYSCQQNFTILTTDGYWNTDSETTPKQVDGSTVIGNQDNGATVTLGEYDGNGSAQSCPSATPSNCTGAAIRTSSSKFSSANTLADGAYYYYNTDLRTSAFGNCTGILGSDVCDNNVPGTTEDPNSQQHMTTFTLGLGVPGTLAYRSDYKTSSTGDFALIKNGTADWPQPRQDDATALDDLWHAAVNGHGTYFSAGDPASLANGLAAALAGVSQRLGSGAAAATSNLEPVAGDNFAYVASYTTVKWYGNVESRTVDTQTGVVSPQATWCVEDVAANVSLGTTACNGTLQSQVSDTSDTRTIYAFSNAAADKLRSFVWSNLTATEQSYFNGSALSQWSTLSVTQKANVTGPNFINYLRGQTGFETRASNPPDNQVFRDRDYTLGDIVGSQPVFVKKPFFNYTDPGYTDFKSSNASRAATVFIAANDGMLHAFNADNGAERWAFVPNAVIPNLYKLADAAYASNHRYFVDGSPAVADVCTANCGNTAAPLPVWKTLLIGSFNAGGRGYYALDITDPAAPKALWEFSPAAKFSGDTVFDADLGYSFGNPIITKLADGTWVVALTSGYNNTSPGDGKGYLYVLDPLTGAILNKIGTGTGNTTTPSGLSRAVAYADEPNKDNTTLFVYGGDLLGNVWRFDINAAGSTGDFQTNNPKLLASLTDPGGTAQPITARMELARVGSRRVVYMATGKYLEATDIDFAGNPLATQTQSIYGIPDRYDEFATSSATTGQIGNLRDATASVQQTLTSGVDGTGRAIRTASANAVNFGVHRNWYIDLTTDSGERTNIDPQLIGGTLLVATNVPTAGACNTGGYSYLNYFDYKTGGYVAGSGGQVSVKAGNALIVGFVVLKLATGYAVNATLSDNPTPTKVTGPVITPGGTGSDAYINTRTSWREILTE